MDARVVIAPVGESPEARSAVVRRAAARGFRAFLCPSDEVDSVPAGTERFVRSAPGIVAPGAPLGSPAVPIAAVATPEELAAALGDAEASGTVAIRWTGDRVIPTETALAQRGRRTRLWVITDRSREVPAALGALEAGADRVFVEVASTSGVDELEQLLEASGSPALAWATARVDEVTPGGIGDRVIVDLTSLLVPEEGMLVGSAAAYLFHVASEAEGSAFTRPRAFRVNAGAAHSYALLADGTTRYLAELESGDRVCIAVPHGPVRSARVGRLKIERRPLLLVRATAGGRRRTLFAQEAETVRLSTQGARIAVTALTAGTEVDGVELPPGRHLGSPVRETIEER